MDKNAIKKYAVWARRELISRVSQRALQYGITDKNIVAASATSVNGVVLSAEEMKERKALIDQINSKGYEQVMEEVAYTWFNRFIALRFMEVNGYLPSHVRVFTDEDNAFKPQILTEAISLELDGLDIEKVYALKEANNDEELFKYLVIVQCNALNPILPGMFQRIADYTELLFPDNLLREGSAIEQMITMIPEEDWKDAVQIIGWLYQYYNSEKKDEVFAALKKNVKVTRENIPAATQLFTPDWIVRYMVENSLGRLWLEHLAASGEGYHYCYDENGNNIASSVVTPASVQQLKSNWKYYLDEAEQEQEVQAQLATIRKEYAQLTPEDIKIIDPCMGSGHILTYAFDVLMQIYESYGYSSREAVAAIIEKNLHGVDIDYRAYQLAYFSIMMKGRQYDRLFFRRNVTPRLAYSTPVYNSHKAKDIFGDEFASFLDNCATADEIGLGSLREANYYTAERVHKTLRECDAFNYDIFERSEILKMCETAADGLKLIDILSQKYDVVITNPPYMSTANMSIALSDYVKKYYPDSKADLFAVFIERCTEMLKPNGYQAMITMHSWMFLSSFEKLREKLGLVDTVSMTHLGARAFEEIGGEVVQTTSFVLRRSNVRDYRGTYCRLVEPTTQQGKEELFLSGQCRFFTQKSSFRKIPGAPIAYWASQKACNSFIKGKPFTGETKKGVLTGDNEKFLRLWHEVNFLKTGYTMKNHNDMISSGLKWFPVTSGGFVRKWYGNLDTVVNLENDGFDIRTTVKNYRLRESTYYFREAITWTEVSTGMFSCRYVPEGVLFGNGGPVSFFYNDYLKYTLGFMNSKVVMGIMAYLAPTVNYGPEQIKKLPIIIEEQSQIEELVNHNIQISKEDWNSNETSWDFAECPMIRLSKELWDATAIGASMHYYYGCHPKVSCPLELCYMLWQGECQERFKQLKENEEELNRIFIDIYGLQDELTPDVEDKDVTVRLADKKRDIRSLISYAVGCMFGRYSLDIPGLVYAGGEWDDSKYVTFKADKDSIIPICDDEYFTDDVVGRFIRFIEVVYGKDTLQENLRFIADALGGSGQPKDVIRNYFLNDFYADHLKIYQKRPIYWLFDSGKKGGFKALVYMHRYQPDTIARMRTDYVHEQQARYRTAIADLEQRIASASTSERVKLSKRLKTLQEQATEIQGYEEKIHHLADQYIAIDLDDGVKKNYAIFQDVLAKIK